MIARRRGVARALALALLAAAAAGCAPPTEPEQLAAFRDSADYQRQRAASETALPALVRFYGDAVEPGVAQRLAAAAGLPTLRPGTLCDARAAVALAAMADGNDAAALVEADLIEADPGCAQTARNVATATRAALFHRRQWPRLSSAEVQRLRDAPAGVGVGSGTSEVLALQGLVAWKALRDERVGAAVQHLRGASVVAGESWAAPVADIVLAASEGRIADALRALKRLADDPAAPARLREASAALLADIEAQAGDVDAPAVGQRLLAAVLWNAAAEQARGRWEGLLQRWGNAFDDAPVTPSGPAREPSAPALQ